MKRALLALGLSFAGCAKSPAPPASIVLVTIDTWRTDAIGASGSGRVTTPNLDALAAGGLYAPKAWASATLTAPSHASILTGVQPYRHGIRDNQGYKLVSGVVTLASALKAAGFRTAAFVSAHPLRHGTGLDAGFDLYDDRMAPGDPLSVQPRWRPGAETIEGAQAWLREGHGRYFLWVHLYEPHDPYEPPAPYHGYYGEVAYVDDLVGRLRAATKDAVWIVCGDHGEALGDHGEMTHGLFVYDATARVPLIVSAPGRIAPRALDAARLVDVMPTALALAGVPIPSGLDGRSLLGRSSGATEAYVETMYAAIEFGAAPVRALSDGTMKAIDVPKRELYDLAADAGESHSLPLERDTGRLFDRLAARPAAPDPPNLAESPESSEALRSLGYVGAGGAYRLGDGGMDPKEFAPLYRTLDEAHAMALARRWPDAASRYASLIASFPRSSMLEQELGIVLLASGRPQDGEPHLERAVSLDPTNVHARLGLANVALARSDFPLAEKRLLAVVAIDPDDVEANFDLGLLYFQALKQPAKARPYWERFLKLQPNDPEAAKIREMLGSIR